MNKKLVLQLLIVLPFLGAAQIKTSGMIYNDSQKNIYVLSANGSVFQKIAPQSNFVVTPNQNYTVYPSDNNGYIVKTGAAVFLYYPSSKCYIFTITTTNNVTTNSNQALPLTGAVHIGNVTTTQNGSSTITQFQVSAS